MGEEAEVNPKPSALNSSNIGFQLLKKCGWTEGSGLGAYEQGRLEPLQPQVKKNKRGLGSEIKKKTAQLNEEPASKVQHDNDKSKKKSKGLSKRARKLKEEEDRMQEKEFERAFLREFWPDNV